MTKQNKILLGVGAIAIASYLVWKNKKKSFANAGGRNECQKPQLPCPKLVGACYTPTRGSIVGTAPIGCFTGLQNTSLPPTTPIPLPQQTPPIIPASPRGFM